MAVKQVKLQGERCMKTWNVEYRNSLSAEDFIKLRKTTGWREIKLQQARRGIENAAYIVSAVVDGETVGMGRLVSDGGYTALICDIIVLPEHQGKGIGKTIVSMIMDYIRNSMEPGESVLVNLMAAKGKEPFYKKFGFIERPNEELGAGMTQWLTKE